MIKGLFSGLSFPYTAFPSSNLTGEQLVPIFYEALMRVERCGLEVIAFTADGNSVNRNLFTIIGINQDGNSLKYKTNNPLSFNQRQVYFISDPPHLIKTSRNCLANSKRNMQVRF